MRMTLARVLLALMPGRQYMEVSPNRGTPNIDPYILNPYYEDSPKR